MTGTERLNVFEKISVIGLGYIGLPTAAMFASRKIKVVGVDVNQHAVDTINRGKIHIIEPDLEGVVRTAVADGFLRAVTKPELADAFLIAVPTPFKGDDHEPDLSYIEAAARAIAPVLVSGNLVVLESTSPVGATETMAAWLAAERPDLTFPQAGGEASDICIAHCPERVLPGKVMQELITNDRVIGGMTPRCSAAAATLYRTFVTGECVLASSPRLAEMAKLTENSFRDVNIAFANELSIVCDKLGIDVWELVEMANRHPRVNILQPSPGVGGHCIAVDPWFIVSSASKEARLIRTAREVNDMKTKWVVEKIIAEISNLRFNNPTLLESGIAIYGLTFKANIDDLRESPAVKIVKALLKASIGQLKIAEPHLDELPSELLGAQLVTPEHAINCKVHVMLVGHNVFNRFAKPKGHCLDFCDVWTSSERS